MIGIGLVDALILLAEEQARMAEQDMDALEAGGHAKHYMFPYNQAEECDKRIKRLRAGTVDLYRREERHGP